VAAEGLREAGAGCAEGLREAGAGCAEGRVALAARRGYAEGREAGACAEELRGGARGAG